MACLAVAARERRREAARRAARALGETDLRKIDIHPNASIGTVVRVMSCKRCSPHPPFARPLGATKRSWYGFDGWVHEDPYHAVLRRVELVASDDIGWAQRQIAMKEKP